EISSMLWTFGEERWHNRIARILVSEREKQPISTTLQLSNIVLKAIPYRYRYRHYRIHPATRTFQAVRIAVNRELETLETAINKAVELLNKKARICVISFHSLEDRIVKHSFRKFLAEGLVEIITPKPLTPLAQEVETNPASRSAKFRVAERL
ncbi:MAG: 16S rRNA (cytosine(1402)-N(4))-methyltransferase RsmH, partial [Candidatus Omnitrophica bacterium]|nr:16S rRNA (cytosine(1402)-N(4))-methyltransferase RsmH [Candidatus Omnitrophota bacterium]